MYLCSHASCPLAMTIITQILNYSTRTFIPECVCEAEDQAWSQSLLSDQGHMDMKSPCGALPLVRNNSSISQVMQTDAVDQEEEEKP